MERRGRITDIATAQPLDLAYIFRVNDGQRPTLIAQADTAGRFVVDLPINVPVKLRAERVGYAGYTFDVPPGSTPLEFQLESRADLAPVVIERERRNKIPAWAIVGAVVLLIVATSDE